ncbi:hypothetical protein TNCV_3111371 [Trichonephila clavipes]|nr:hypothetical protein TNCV_3111371 [Trichonephila clavipes]
MRITVSRAHLLVSCSLGQEIGFPITISPHVGTSNLFMVHDQGKRVAPRTAMAGSDVVQSGRPIFDDFFQHLWSYIANNTANVVFQMVKRLWLIRIDQ